MIDPDICCKVCQMAADSITSRALDMRCVDCCVRHLLQTIDSLERFGRPGHKERIEDKLFVALERRVHEERDCKVTAIPSEPGCNRKDDKQRTR